jgi:hypothetical protein
MTSCPCIIHVFKGLSSHPGRCMPYALFVFGVSPFGRSVDGPAGRLAGRLSDERAAARNSPQNAR